MNIALCVKENIFHYRLSPTNQLFPYSLSYSLVGGLSVVLLAAGIVCIISRMNAGGVLCNLKLKYF